MRKERKMAKKILTLILSLALLICLACTVSAEDLVTMDPGSGNPLVIDEADLLSDYEEEQLEKLLKATGADYDVELVFITVDGMNGMDIESFADDIYDSAGYGVGPDHDGALLLIDMDTRMVHLTTTGYVIDAVFDTRVDELLDDVCYYLGNGQNFEAAKAYVNDMDYYLYDWAHYEPGPAPGPQPDPFENYTLWDKILYTLRTAGLGCAAAGAATGGIATAATRGRLKSVSAKHDAADYRRPGSFVLTQSNDIYLYSHTTQHRIHYDDGGRPGGGSHSGFSSTHVSSSGTTHGGGSHSF